MSACTCGHTETVETLLAVPGIDVNLSDVVGSTEHQAFRVYLTVNYNFDYYARKVGRPSQLFALMDTPKL